MITSANSVARRPLMLRNLIVVEIMNANPLAFPRNLPIQNAAGLLARNGFDAAPVIDDDGRLLGLVTSGSCLAWEEFSLRSDPLGFASEDLGFTPMHEISSPRVDKIDEGASADEAFDRLSQRGARRLYVVNDRDVLVGVVSRVDLLRYLTDRANLSSISRDCTGTRC